jgi:protein involved in polysaccharide export with SLBB domain
LLRHFLPILVGVLLGLVTSGSAQDKSEKLRVGDIIHVNVVGEEITGEFEISKDGSFQMSYLDEPVPAAGKTTLELQATLMKMLKPDYLLNPQIIVTLRNKKLHSCTVIGQVAAPSLIEFDPDEGITLQEAIGRAGDLTRAGDKYGIEITRYGKSIPAPMPQSKNLKIANGDTINVPLIAQLGTYSLSGHVRKTGKFEIPRDGRYSIMWAIDNAGGVSETGSLKRVELRRAGRTRDFEDERELELETIRPGDLIKVDRRKF